MSNFVSKDVRYERCPRCNTVIQFKATDTSATCKNCGAKIRLK